jgi:hypothetical protein
MVSSRKIWAIAFGSLLVLIAGLLVYGAKESDSWQAVAVELKKLKAEEVAAIQFLPENPDWDINLTLEPIELTGSTAIQAVLEEIQAFKKEAHKKVPETRWEMRLRIIPKQPEALVLKNSKSIILRFRRLKAGLFFEMTRVMGYQTFRCPDSLISRFEALAQFEKPLGRKK